MYYDSVSPLPPIDYHIHSNWSPDVDSHVTIDRLAYLYKCNNYATIIITDHSYSSKFSTKQDVLNYKKECVFASLANNIHVIPGIEVDIDIDGNLDMDPELLQMFDFVTGAIHREHNENTTNRLMTAICSNKIDAVAHPTNAIIGVRDPSPMNHELIFNAAAKYRVALEINGIRQDLCCKYITMAKKLGCRFICSSDSHNENGVDHLEWCKQVAVETKLNTKDFYNLS